jgi:hypothetical protein
VDQVYCIPVDYTDSMPQTPGRGDRKTLDVNADCADHVHGTEAVQRQWGVVVRRARRRTRRRLRRERRRGAGWRRSGLCGSEQGGRAS